MTKKWLILMSCALFLTGCASAGKLYPNFSEQKTKIKNVTVFIDATFMKDGVERGMIMDVDQNIALLDILGQQIQKELPAKGYPVNAVYALAGTIMVELNTMPIEIKGRKHDNIPYADKAFFASRIPLEDLRAAYWGLIRAEEKKKPDQANVIIPEFQSLKSPGSPDAYILVRSGGIQVGFMKQLGQAFGSALATAGFMYGYSTGQVSTYLYVIDAQSGEVMWKDSITAPGSSMTRWTVADEIRDILKRFPAK